MNITYILIKYKADFPLGWIFHVQHGVIFFLTKSAKSCCWKVRSKSPVMFNFSAACRRRKPIKLQWNSSWSLFVLCICWFYILTLLFFVVCDWNIEYTVRWIWCTEGKHWFEEVHHWLLGYRRNVAKVTVVFTGVQFVFMTRTCMNMTSLREERFHPVSHSLLGSCMNSLRGFPKLRLHFYSRRDDWKKPYSNWRCKTVLNMANFKERQFYLKRLIR